MAFSQVPLGGKLQNKVKDLHQNLLEVMAFLEAKIDFPEEEDIEGYERAEIKKEKKVSKQIKKLIDSYENGKITTEGLNSSYRPPECWQVNSYELLSPKRKELLQLHQEQQGTT